ncbi:MAG TPA: glycogen synthase, partial [Burkholderiaceae bacterium]|nr:glycogen synthase [Burkholderiaceae bacterium]
LGCGSVSWRPDVVHLNEWQSGPAAALLAHAGPDAPPTLFTIHNMAFQGLFDASVLDFLRLPACVFDVGGVEFFGKVSFLKAGIRYANRIATVSRTYAKEIMTPEFGFGLDGLLRQRADDVVGILNGADYEEWNPQSDPHIAARFDPDNLIGKGKCKAALQAQLGLQANAGVPILAYMSRLTHQKLTDVLVDALPMILARGVQVVVLGRGDRVLEAALLMLARRFAGELAVRADYDEVLARQILAGADMLLAPARFEPCGLTQMYALRYGTVPIVSLIGGLTETVVDARADTLSDGSATGFVFHERSLLGLLGGVDRALALYRASAVWHMLQRNGMQVDFSWDRSTREYEAVYEALVATQSVRGAASPPRPGEERSPPQPVREVVL